MFFKIYAKKNVPDSKKVNLILADDHPVLLKGLALLISKIDSNFNILGLAENGKVLIDLIKKKEPDIIIMDLDMPVLNGFDALKIISVKFPKVKTIIYSLHYIETYKEELIMNGARSYLPKNADPNVILDTIYRVHQDGYYFEEEMSKQIITSTIYNRLYKNEWDKINLTDRELEILKLICEEKTNNEISKNLKIAVSTVEFHRKNIYKKVNTESIVGVIKYAICRGLT